MKNERSIKNEQKFAEILERSRNWSRTGAKQEPNGGRTGADQKYPFINKSQALHE